MGGRTNAPELGIAPRRETTQRSEGIVAQPLAPEAQTFVLRIEALARKSVETIIEIGRVLLEAKATLPHGSFATMIQLKLPFGARTAQRLMEIADNAALANATHGSLLPASWTTLHELSRLPQPVLVKALDKGIVNPGMKRRDVVALRAEGRAGIEKHASTRVVNEAPVTPVGEPTPLDSTEPELPRDRTLHAIRSALKAYQDSGGEDGKPSRPCERKSMAFTAHRFVLDFKYGRLQ